MLEGEIYRTWKVGTVQDDFKVSWKRFGALKKNKE